MRFVKIIQESHGPVLKIAQHRKLTKTNIIGLISLLVGLQNAPSCLGFGHIEHDYDPDSTGNNYVSVSSGTRLTTRGHSQAAGMKSVTLPTVAPPRRWLQTHHHAIIKENANIIRSSQRVPSARESNQDHFANS